MTTGFIDILLIWGVLGSLVVSIASYIVAKSNIKEFGDKIRTFNDDIILLKTDLKQIQGRFDTFNTSYYEDLLKKVHTIEQEKVTLEHKFRGLDDSVKNFYSKWARKLGNIAKKEEESENVLSAPEGAWPQEDLIEQINNKKSAPPKRSGWTRR